MTGTYRIASHVLSAPPLEPALYLVATPIGNLRDITLRGLETLAASDVLACEDTRVTRKLLDRYGIQARLVTYHEHNAHASGPELIRAVLDGKAVALVSDAGTPLISDPGYRLVSQAHAAGVNVIAIPGASSVLAALASSGLPSDDFRFIGFLPTKDKARRDTLVTHMRDRSTIIAFESPNRLVDTLRAIADVMGEKRMISVSRELTKRFETIRIGSAADLVAQFADEVIRGEIVVLIAPDDSGPAMLDDAAIDAMLADLLVTLPAAKAAKEAARLTGRPKAELYQRCLVFKGP